MRQIANVLQHIGFCETRSKNQSLQLKKLHLTGHLRRPYWSVKKTAVISDIFDDGSNINHSLDHQ